MLDVLAEVVRERERQDKRFPDQHLPDGTSAGCEPSEPTVAMVTRYQRERAAKTRVRHLVIAKKLTWEAVLEEEVAEACSAMTPEHLREELIQVAAVCVRWIQDIDGRRV